MYLFICLHLLLICISGLGYITGACAGHVMGQWQWALRVSHVFWQFSYIFLFHFSFPARQTHDIVQSYCHVAVLTSSISRDTCSFVADNLILFIILSVQEQLILYRAVSNILQYCIRPSQQTKQCVSIWSNSTARITPNTNYVLTGQLILIELWLLIPLVYRHMLHSISSTHTMLKQCQTMIYDYQCLAAYIGPLLQRTTQLLPSARQHLSYGDFLKVKKEYYQNSSVLDCVTQCSQSAAH